MSLEKQIQEELKVAMKAKDKDKLEALRAIKSAILLLKTEKGGNDDITDDQELRILQKLTKQRKDSAELYNQQGRSDLAEKELIEATVIEGFLPKQLTPEELEDALNTIIEKVGASSPQEMGKVMGIATKELAGKADGKSISLKVKELLSK